MACASAVIRRRLFMAACPPRPPRNRTNPASGNLQNGVMIPAHRELVGATGILGEDR